MIIPMIGTAATPLIMALQINALTGSREVKLSAASDKGRRCDRHVEGWSPSRPLGKADTPMQPFTQGVSGAAR